MSDPRNYPNSPYYAYPPPPAPSNQTKTFLAVLACVLILGILSVVLLCLTVGRTLFDRTFYYRINVAGNTDMSRHNYAAAIKEYTRMVDARPMKEDGYEFRGNAERGIGQYQDALADYTYALQLLSTPQGIDEIGFPSYTHAQKVHAIPSIREDLYIDRGICYDAMGRRTAAIADYTSALANKTAYDWQAHWNRGEDYRIRRRFPNAIVDATWVVAKYPKRYSVYRQRAYIYSDAGNLPAAEADYAHAIQLKSDDFDLYYALGQLYERAHQYGADVQVWRKAVGVLPGNSGSWTDLGWAQYLAGDIKGCVDSSRQAILVDPKSVYPRYNLALCYAIRNDWADAQPAYRQAMALSRPPDVAAGLGDVENALKTHPNSAALKSAEALLKAGRPGR